MIKMINNKIGVENETVNGIISNKWYKLNGIKQTVYSKNLVMNINKLNDYILRLLTHI